MGGSSDAPTNGDTKSPKQSNSASPSRQDAVADSKQTDLMKPEGGLNSEVSKPLAPPPKPGQTQGNGTPDYFSSQAGGSLSLEPNPFEQSFGGGQPETPGGTKLPSVAALTSPSSLIPGTGTTPFNWPGGSLRTGPLSPAMLSGPTADYFGDHHIRGGFPTPNESSLRTGLTPGGSGSMFPAPSPNSALLAQLAGSGATPGTLDFHRTALSAKRELQNASTATATTQAPDASDVALPISKAEAKPASGPFDPHDNDAANGLYMLAQGRNGAQTSTQYPSVSQPAVHAHPAPIPPQALDTSPQLASINGGSVGSGSIRGASEVSAGSEESEQPKPTTRGKGRKNTNSTTTSSGRRKAEDAGTGRTPKKAKGNAGAAMTNGDFHSEDEDKDESTTSPTKSKMTDEEKRKNFLERNRVAALKCRQRKKQWLQNLQSKVEMYSAENENLTTQIGQLREEVVNLKTLLLAHKDCPVTQQQALQQGGVGPILQVVEPFNQLNPYGMATAIANGAVIGQPRRFS